MKHWLVLAGATAVMSLGTSQLMAQPNGGPGGGGPGGRGNFDPAQFRQRMMDYVKEALEVTNDDEWKVLEPRVQKIMDARMQMGGPGMGRFMMGRRNRGGDNAQGDQGQRRRFGPEPSAEEEALQKAIDSKASKAELKAALDKYLTARKNKQADLEKAQASLRELLTPRQEAIAALNGLL